LRQSGLRSPHWFPHLWSKGQMLAGKTEVSSGGGNNAGARTSTVRRKGRFVRKHFVPPANAVPGVCRDNYLLRWSGDFPQFLLRWSLIALPGRQGGGNNVRGEPPPAAESAIRTQVHTCNALTNDGLAGPDSMAGPATSQDMMGRGVTTSNGRLQAELAGCRSIRGSCWHASS
jgi:hypothetical protein